MARAGRKRKVGVKREASGRVQRQSVENKARDEMQTAIEYRQKVFGVSAADAKDQKAATLLGRMCLTGSISDAQWQAGEDWLKLLSAYHAAINAPRGFSTHTIGTSTMSDEEHARRCAAAKKRMDDANKAVQGHAPMEEAKERFIALRTVIVEEMPADRMNGALRTALNGLVKHFGLEAKKAA